MKFKLENIVSEREGETERERERKREREEDKPNMRGKTSKFQIGKSTVD